MSLMLFCDDLCSAGPYITSNHLQIGGVEVLGVCGPWWHRLLIKCSITQISWNPSDFRDSKCLAQDCCWKNSMGSNSVSCPRTASTIIIHLSFPYLFSDWKMVEPLAIVEKLFDVALLIKDHLEKVQYNKEQCSLLVCFDFGIFISQQSVSVTSTC